MQFTSVPIPSLIIFKSAMKVTATALCLCSHDSPPIPACAVREASRLLQQYPISAALVSLIPRYLLFSPLTDENLPGSGQIFTPKTELCLLPPASGR